MPLDKSGSKEAFVNNIKAELGAGKPRAQALAIAYATKRRGKSVKSDVSEHMRKLKNGLRT